MAIVPDTKDWTCVLVRPCPECGLDTRRVQPGAVAGLLRDVAADWERVLAGAPDQLRQRPDAATWSPVEYACHVRDVFRVFDSRLLLMLTEDDPEFANWDQDETAVAERYGEQDPAVVQADLHEAAQRLAARFEQVQGEQWRRHGRRSDGARFTVTSFARYLVHDPVHHLYDVTGRHAAPSDRF